MLKQQGYARLYDPDAPGGVIEKDTTTCGHCNRVTHIRPGWVPKEDDGVFKCHCCQRFICKACYVRGECDVIERKLERAEASYHARRSYGL